jgi:hypothetical protein
VTVTVSGSERSFSNSAYTRHAPGLVPVTNPVVATIVNPGAVSATTHVGLTPGTTLPAAFSRRAESRSVSPSWTLGAVVAISIAITRVSSIVRFRHPAAASAAQARISRAAGRRP